MQLSDNPRSTIQIGGHPIHVMLVPFVIAFYTGTFASDIVFAATADPFWARGAFWLLVGAVGVSIVAASIGLIDFLAEPRIRALSESWWHLAANALASAISIADLYLRYILGVEAGSHDYIWLAGIVFALMLFAGWMGGQMVYRHRVGVSG
jgi:uncharacterized membrane protein